VCVRVCACERQERARVRRRRGAARLQRQQRRGGASAIASLTKEEEEESEQPAVAGGEKRQSRNLTGENSSLDAAAGVGMFRRRQIGDAPLPLRPAGWEEGLRRRMNSASGSADATKHRISSPLGKLKPISNRNQSAPSPDLILRKKKKTDPWTVPAYGNRRNWRAGARLR
jgi:hypothetical protein